MEIAKAELAALETVIVNAPVHQVQELTDLELVLVGGGIGEVILG
jgi:hypothetical protein